MSQQEQRRMVNEDFEPSDSEDAILKVLKREGRANPYLIREESELTKQTVNEGLRQLIAAGWVKKVVRGLYEFNEDPREGGEE